MTRQTLPVWMLAISLGPAGLVLAQAGPGWGGPRDGGPRNSDPRDGGPRGEAIRRFEQSAPGLGELMPDLVVHDQSGQELRLRELGRGHTTVLVLGCLT